MHGGVAGGVGRGEVGGDGTGVENDEPTIDEGREAGCDVGAVRLVAGSTLMTVRFTGVECDRKIGGVAGWLGEAGKPSQKNKNK